MKLRIYFQTGLQEAILPNRLECSLCPPYPGGGRAGRSRTPCPLHGRGWRRVTPAHKAESGRLQHSRDHCAAAHRIPAWACDTSVRLPPQAREGACPVALQRGAAVRWGPFSIASSTAHFPGKGGALHWLLARTPLPRPPDQLPWGGCPRHLWTWGVLPKAFVDVWGQRTELSGGGGHPATSPHSHLILQTLRGRHQRPSSHSCVS